MSTTLHVTVESNAEFFDSALTDLRQLEAGEELGDQYVLSLPDETALERLFRAKNIELLRAIATEQPESVRALARTVDRDVKNVSTALDELAELGLVRLEEEGRSKRPVVPYDDIDVEIGISGSEGDDPAPTPV